MRLTAMEVQVSGRWFKVGGYETESSSYYRISEPSRQLKLENRRAYSKRNHRATASKQVAKRE